MSSPADPSSGRPTVESSIDEKVARIVLRGDADVANVEHLGLALAGIELDGARQAVHIDVSELGFVDAAALRLLTSFASGLRDHGHDVTTHGGQPLFVQLVHLVGAHDHLGLA
jgi:anti-anti-sigma regulatory factor